MSYLITDSPRIDVVSEPFADYQKFQALNHSALKLSDIHGKGCPRKAYAELTSKWSTEFKEDPGDEDEPEEDVTSAMAFGTLYHTFLLEPGLFRKSAAVLDSVMMARLYEEALATGSKAKGFSKLLATYKAWKASVEASGLTMVDERTIGRMEDMREALFRDDDIQAELVAVEKSEISVYFALPVSGSKMEAPFVQCKARIDAYYPGTILDLKTCRTAHPLEFAREITSRGYDTQLAWYRIAAKCAGLTVDRCGLLAQESAFPYLAAIHWIGDDWLTYSRREIMRVYYEFAACLNSGKFPGYGSGEIMPPVWLQDAIEATA